MTSARRFRFLPPNEVTLPMDKHLAVRSISYFVFNLTFANWRATGPAEYPARVSRPRRPWCSEERSAREPALNALPKLMVRSQHERTPLNQRGGTGTRAKRLC
jgi:hypothetical protein